MNDWKDIIQITIFLFAVVLALILLSNGLDASGVFLQ